jgi:glycosyltransferase involved in cell wall biosynthesis
MNTLSRSTVSRVQKHTLSQTSCRVCMHVLGTARTDVRVMREATALAEAGYEVFVVDIETARDRPVEERISGVVLKHIMIPRAFSSIRFKPLLLFQAARLLIRSTLQLIHIPADVYHAHDTSALLACFLAGLIQRKPLVFDAHELPLSGEVKNRRWRGLITLFSWFLAFAVPRCAGIITVSPPIVEELCRRYARSDVSLVRNVPSYQQVSRSQRLRQHLHLPQDAHIALYQGAFSTNRGLERLIQAAAFLEPGNLIVFMGPDTEGLRSQFESLIASEGVVDRVKMLPAVPYEELLDWTASADIGLIVYTPEHSQNVQMCLPNKLFEYLMVGLPILASQLDAVSDIIATYDVGRIIPSLTEETIGTAINAMLADHMALARMRYNALEAVRETLCWEKESQQLLRLYQRVLKL